jgi:hypothetical protein
MILFHSNLIQPLSMRTALPDAHHSAFLRADSDHAEDRGCYLRGVLTRSIPSADDRLARYRRRCCCCTSIVMTEDNAVSISFHRPDCVYAWHHSVRQTTRTRFSGVASGCFITLHSTLLTFKCLALGSRRKLSGTFGGQNNPSKLSHSCLKR